MKKNVSSYTSHMLFKAMHQDELEKADDFLTVFDKFCYWRGEGDITTFCWSKADFNQLWAELS